jgi:hypothetical protein
MKQRYFQFTVIFFSLFICFNSLKAQEDTLRVMVQNVLHYGDGCQGSNSFLHSQLEVIVKYANPDVVGLVKMQSIKVTPTDNNGISPYGFPDSIINNALNVAYPGRYSYCALTNVSASNDMDILFYNKNKLGFVSVRTLCTLSEDFDLYKLYYKDPYLATTHDSTFLYFILNHTVSGAASAQRDQQDTTIIYQLKKIFYHLPNLISMGDFNTRSSLENGYKAYCLGTDTNYIFYDQPFNPDHNLTYPINWDAYPTLCPAFLNTSTREYSIPNSCGSTSGGKDWYEHEFMSGWLSKNIDFMKYISNSYVTIGNDGNRVGISVNDTVSHGKNLSAPYSVLSAVFQLSDKYPVMLSLGVTYDSLGNGPINPVNSVPNPVAEKDEIKINNPVNNNLIIHFPASEIGGRCKLDCIDVTGRNIFREEIEISSTTFSAPFSVKSGVYLLRLQTAQAFHIFRVIKL